MLFKNIKYQEDAINLNLLKGDYLFILVYLGKFLKQIMKTKIQQKVLRKVQIEEEALFSKSKPLKN